MSYNTWGTPTITQARRNVQKAVESKFDIGSVVGAARYIAAFEDGAKSRDDEVAGLKARIKRLEADNLTFQQEKINDAAALNRAHADVHAALCEMIAHGVRFRLTTAADFAGGVS